MGVLKPILMMFCCSQLSESDNEFEAAEPKSAGRGASRRQKNAAGGETTMVSLLVSHPV